MRPDQLGGKDVIDANAYLIGDVCDVEFDVSRWMVTHICVNLSDRAIALARALWRLGFFPARGPINSPDSKTKDSNPRSSVSVVFKIFDTSCRVVYFGNPTYNLSLLGERNISLYARKL